MRRPSCGVRGSNPMLWSATAFHFKSLGTLVALDWTLDLLFGRDYVSLGGSSRRDFVPEKPSRSATTPTS
jgi:hypothetical protein